MLKKFKFKDTILLVLILCLFNLSCKKKKIIPKEKKIFSNNIVVGADRFRKYISLVKDKKIAVVANQTSIVKSNTVFIKNGEEIFSFINIHLVDFLLSRKMKVQKVFAPEHGFRGKADAGEHVKNGIDSKTKLPIISLYGKNKKPTSEQLKGIETIIFDIQDVGARFYTYISTLHYIMEACAENNISLIVLDRPNPNGYYIDGPVLEKENRSFVGMHSVPVVYGMTIGEYAKMINGEKWLANNLKCNLTVISLQNYTHQTKYDLPIKPSPNLPNAKAINLYPSLAFFEGTSISCGRGTEKQFQVFGSPFLPKEKYTFTFTPNPNFGSKHPKHNGKICFGENLTNESYLNQLNLSYLIHAYKDSKDKKTFFNSFFTKLAGTKKLQKQIENGLSETEIRSTWQKELNTFKEIRKKYLLYE